MDILHCIKDFISNWTRGYLCNTLLSNLAILCRYHKKLPEAKVENSGLISLEWNVSTECGIDSVEWLLIISLLCVYNKKKQKWVRNIGNTVWGENGH